MEYASTKFSKLSDWIMLEHCAARIVVGGDINNVADRVAFIEKTPRIRINKDKFVVEQDNPLSCSISNNDAWLYGPKGSSEYGEDQDSRKWCDKALAVLGWY